MVEGEVIKLITGLVIAFTIAFFAASGILRSKAPVLKSMPVQTVGWDI